MAKTYHLGRTRRLVNTAMTPLARLGVAGRSERLTLDEVGAEEAAPVLQQYLKRVPVVRPFFDVRPGSRLAEFEAEAPRHPVLRLTAASDPEVDPQHSPPSAV